MKRSEVIAAMNKIDPEGDPEIVISAFGGMRTGKKIARVQVGFDWDHGSIVIIPAVQLTVFKPERVELSPKGQ